MKKKITEMFESCMKEDDSDQHYIQRIVDRIDGTINIAEAKAVEEAVLRAMKTIEDLQEYEPMEVALYFKEVVERVVNQNM